MKAVRMVGAAAGRAFPWASGAAAGVALGAYLTAVGGAGAPGVEAMDSVTDLLTLPALAFAIVFASHLCVQAVSAALTRS